MEKKYTLAESYLNMGNELVSKGLYKEAIRHFKKAAKLVRNFELAYFGLGYCYERLGIHKKALKSFKKVIKINPNNELAHFLLGKILGKLGSIYGMDYLLEESIKEYEKVIEIEPNFAKAYFNIGTIYGLMGDYPKAIEAFKNALIKQKIVTDNYKGDEINSKSIMNIDLSDAHASLGRLYTVTGDKESALKEYEILKSIDKKAAAELLDFIYQYIKTLEIIDEKGAAELLDFIYQYIK